MHISFKKTIMHHTECLRTNYSRWLDSNANYKYNSFNIEKALVQLYDIYIYDITHWSLLFLYLLEYQMVDNNRLSWLRSSPNQPFWRLGLLFLKEQFTQKWKFAENVLHPRAIEDQDEFVSSSDSDKCLSNGCFAVNGCRQNESW